jgi:hypothetical protein
LQWVSPSVYFAWPWQALLFGGVRRWWGFEWNILYCSIAFADRCQWTDTANCNYHNKYHCHSAIILYTNGSSKYSFLLLTSFCLPIRNFCCFVEYKENKLCSNVNIIRRVDLSCRVGVGGWRLFFIHAIFPTYVYIYFARKVSVRLDFYSLLQVINARQSPARIAWMERNLQYQPPDTIS